MPVTAARRTGAWSFCASDQKVRNSSERNALDQLYAGIRRVLRYASRRCDPLYEADFVGKSRAYSQKTAHAAHQMVLH
jgi:hypothetical protein